MCILARLPISRLLVCSEHRAHSDNGANGFCCSLTPPHRRMHSIFNCISVFNQFINNLSNSREPQKIPLNGSFARNAAVRNGRQFNHSAKQWSYYKHFAMPNHMRLVGFSFEPRTKKCRHFTYSDYLWARIEQLFRRVVICSCCCRCRGCALACYLICGCWRYPRCLITLFNLYRTSAGRAAWKRPNKMYWWTRRP